MRCVKCGAKLRRNDRFCPSCGCSVSPEASEIEYPGASVGRDKNRKNQKGRSKEPDILYDEHLYRDTFLEERGEERSQALLITMVSLLIILLLAGSFLMYYFVIRGRSGGEVLSSDGGITILQDGNQTLQDQPGAGGEGLTEETPEETLTENGQPEALLQTAGTQPAGESGGQENEPPETDSPGAARQESEPQETEETPETKAETEHKEGSLQGVPEGIAEIIKEFSDAQRYGVYVYDLKTGDSCIAGDGEKPMYASAVISVPILYTAAALLDEGKITLDDTIVYENSVGGRGEAFPEEKDGKPYPLSYYLKAMLAYSDNNCMNCLADFLGLDVVNNTCHEAGYGSVDLQRKIVAEVTDNTENYISAADLGGMVYELYSGKFRQINKAYMEENFRIEESEEGSTIIGLAQPVRSMERFLNQDGLGDTRFAEVAVAVDGENGFVLSEMMMGEDGFSYIDAGIEIAAYVCRTLAER